MVVFDVFFLFFFFWYVVTIVALEGAATHPRTRFAQKDNNGYAVLLHRLSVRTALFPVFFSTRHCIDRQSVGVHFIWLPTTIC